MQWLGIFGRQRAWLEKVEQRELDKDCEMVIGKRDTIACHLAIFDFC